jgi:hypothetical protein
MARLWSDNVEAWRTGGARGVRAGGERHGATMGTRDLVFIGIDAKSCALYYDAI